MTKTQSLLRRILAWEDGDIRSLACAVDVVGELMFDDHMEIDDIRLKRHVYPEAARRRGKSVAAVSRSAQRMARLCWDRGEPEVWEEVLGHRPRRPPLPKGERAVPEKPKRIMMYLASYLRLGIPYRKALEQDPALFG